MSDAQEDLVDLKEATRHAHEAIKDLRLATREAKEVIDSLDSLITEKVGERINKAVDTGLGDFKETLTESLEKATDAVFKRFDTLFEIMMGQDKKSKRMGLPSVNELLDEW